MGKKFLITEDILRLVGADPFTYYFAFDTYEILEKKDIGGHTYTIPFVGAPQVNVINGITSGAGAGRRERWTLLEKRYRLDLVVVWCNENAIEYEIDESAL